MFPGHTPCVQPAMPKLLASMNIASKRMPSMLYGWRFVALKPILKSLEKGIPAAAAWAVRSTVASSHAWKELGACIILFDRSIKLMQGVWLGGSLSDYPVQLAVLAGFVVIGLFVSIRHFRWV